MGARISQEETQNKHNIFTFRPIRIDKLALETVKHHKISNIQILSTQYGWRGGRKGHLDNREEAQYSI